MLIGPFCNGLAVIIGGLIGAFLSTRVPKRVRTSLPQTFGLMSVALGIVLIVKVKYMPAVALTMIVGSLIGELCYVERWIGRLAGMTRGVVDKFFPPSEGLSHEEFTHQFVVILILFCASGTGIFGSMHEGMTGDPSILYIKSIMDVFTAIIFASTLGYAVAVIGIPMVLVQLGLAWLGAQLMPYLTQNMMDDFSTAGGVLMMATGLRICGIKLFPVANMLPGLVLAMPFSYLWEKLMVL